MERKRNRPEKYNRETMNQTVKAINKITEVLTWPFSQFHFPDAVCSMLGTVISSELALTPCGVGIVYPCGDFDMYSVSCGISQ